MAVMSKIYHGSLKFECFGGIGKKKLFKICAALILGLILEYLANNIFPHY